MEFRLAEVKRACQASPHLRPPMPSTSLFAEEEVKDPGLAEGGKHWPSVHPTTPTQPASALVIVIVILKFYVIVYKFLS